MKKLIYSCVFSLIFYSCTTNKEDHSASSEALFPQPIAHPLKLADGYLFNLITGDSAMLIINTNGDTIKSGTPEIIKGSTFSADIYEKPQIITLGPSTKKSVGRHNRLDLQGAPKITAAQWEINSRPKLEQRYSDFLLTNSTGKKIKTGTPLKIEGRKVNWKQEKPITALPLLMTDNAVGNIQSLDVDQGLNSSYVLCMLQDQFGNIWFGTYGGGLTRYNGHSFTHFNQKNGIPNEIVRTIFEDSQGNIWIGSTGGGFTKFNGEYFELFNEDVGAASNDIYCFFEDKDKAMWVGHSGGATRIFNNEFTHYSIKEGMSSIMVRCITQDHNGQIWFGTEKGICAFDGEQWKKLILPDVMEFEYITSIITTGDSAVWFAIPDDGLYKYKDDSLKKYSPENGLSSNMIWSIEEDNSGKLWLATSSAGMMSFDEKEFYYITKNDGLPNDNIRSILEDDCGNLWFGSYGGGVYRYKPNSFYHLNEYDGLPNNIARAILEDKFGNIWFGTTNGGICIYNDKEFIFLDSKIGLDNFTVKSFYQTKDGAIWIGTDGAGAFRYDGKTVTVYNQESGLLNGKILVMHQDHESNLWFGTNGDGLIKATMDSTGSIRSFTRFSDPEGFANNVVVYIMQDDQKNYWFATDGGGVTKYDGNYMTNYAEQQGLSHRNILSFTQDIHGNYWAGTYGGGLNIFDGKNILHITEEEGLSSNTVWAVREIPNTKNPTMWVSTEKGLNFIEVETDGDVTNDVTKYKFKINRFTKQDGLKGQDFYANSICLDSKNRMWWGSGKGVEMLELNSFNTSQIIPKPKLDYIEINEDFIDFRNLVDSIHQFDFDKIEPFANFPNQLTLPYDQNHIKFNFSAIDWTSPHKINYRYRLVGLSDEWSYSNEKSEADFRNIPYGDYTFEACAIGESQIWSEPFVYAFTIRPPWWHTWWFRIFASILIVIILYSIYRWRTASLIQQQKILEQKVADRTEDLEQEKIKVEEKHKEITDSINYAERIQRSFLATEQLLNDKLKNYFVFFQPKGVVSGDFYWAKELSNSNFVYVCADSTGHGVPGAIMSILNVSSLELAVKEGNQEPAAILNYTRKEIIERLKKDGSAEGGKDGMDASLILLNKEKTKLVYASANNPVWILRKNEIIELSADKMPVGKHDKDQTPFTQHEFDLEKNDVIYSFTDGMPDQFGGEKGKKYKYTQLKSFLISIGDKPMQTQHQLLKQDLENWKGSLEQVDDVCIIGVRI